MRFRSDWLSSLFLFKDLCYLWCQRVGLPLTSSSISVSWPRTSLMKMRMVSPGVGRNVEEAKREGPLGWEARVLSYFARLHRFLQVLWPFSSLGKSGDEELCPTVASSFGCLRIYILMQQVRAWGLWFHVGSAASVCAWGELISVRWRSAHTQADTVSTEISWWSTHQGTGKLSVVRLLQIDDSATSQSCFIINFVIVLFLYFPEVCHEAQDTGKCTFY